MIPILYILGSGSRYQNNELRYSLRSVEKYVPTASRIIVVGEDPGFLSQKVEFYPLAELEGNKQFRMAKKVEWACQNILDGDFLFSADDVFHTNPNLEVRVPYYCKGVLPEKEQHKSTYQTARVLTRKYLQSINKPTHDFDTHAPIVFNSEKFLALSEAWTHYSPQHNAGVLNQSLYANFYHETPTPYKDVKLNRLRTEEDFDLLELNQNFSCSDDGWRSGVAEYLELLFPNKSKYEK